MCNCNSQLTNNFLLQHESNVAKRQTESFSFSLQFCGEKELMKNRCAVQCEISLFHSHSFQYVISVQFGRCLMVQCTQIFSISSFQFECSRQSSSRNHFGCRFQPMNTASKFRAVSKHWQ